MTDIETFTSTYKFGATGDRPYSEIETAQELTDLLSKMVAAAFCVSPAGGYAAFREDICDINIEMNLRQEVAPRFRSMRRLPKEPKTIDEASLSLDRQVIDMHWRAFSVEKPDQPIERYEGLFENAPFNCEIAEEFAKQKWGMDAKVTHLYLNDSMQWEHAVLQSKRIRDKWRIIERGDVRGGIVTQRGIPHVEAQLKQTLLGQPHLKKYIPSWLRIWKAAQMINGNSPTQLTKMISLMSGEPAPDPSATAKTYQSLKNRLAASRK